MPWIRAGLAAVLAGALGVTSLALVDAAGAASTGGPVVTVNGKAPRSDSTRLPGCTMTVAVSGLPTGSHQIDVAITAMDPTGSKPVLTISEPDVVGDFSTGAHNMANDLFGTYSRSANGFHLRTTVKMDGTQIASGPFWLACGAVQHGGHSVQVVISIEWKNSAGVISTTPPKGMPRGFDVRGNSPQGRANCAYYPHGLGCRYVLTETPEEGPPAGLRVSGLGTYTIEETHLPKGWYPDLKTVGQFASNPDLVQWTGAEDDEEEAAVAALGLSPHAHGPALLPHVIVNVQHR